jgi:uracil-DNA glycosylase family protein
MSPSLATLRAEAAGCRRCDLWKLGTQTVFGEGRTRDLMLVGEQPGDVEDVEGRPFVGPAGRLLRELLEEAGIEEERVYLTNAVKHFKWRPAGKRRLHDKPTWTEVQACLHWLTEELEAVKPALVVCLGATAAQALLGKSARVGKLRGQAVQLENGTPTLVTLHPSAVLRAGDEREERRRELLADLELARATMAELAPSQRSKSAKS